MSVLIKSMEMPKSCWRCTLSQLYEKPREMLVCKITHEEVLRHKIDSNCPLVHVPPHGDLIDRDALIKDGWLNLHKEVIRMGGYAIHELPLKNPLIPVIIQAEEGET